MGLHGLHLPVLVARKKKRLKERKATVGIHKHRQKNIPLMFSTQEIKKLLVYTETMRSCGMWYFDIRGLVGSFVREAEISSPEISLSEISS